MRLVLVYLRKNRLFAALLAVAFLVHLVFLPGFHELWWDSGVYVGMGKHLFSAGGAGLWENIRPPVLPVILGLFWAAGLPVIFFGRVLELFFCIGSVFLLYEITRHYFKEEAALFASVLFAFSPIFFYLSFHLYTEIPAVFFLLLSVYLFVLKKYYFSGFFVAVAFLTKFPAGMFLPLFLLVLLLNREIKDCFRLLAGFFALLLPVLLAYHLIYGNALFPFIEARRVISEVLGCNVLRFKPWWQYFYWIFFENIFHLFALIGFIAFFAGFRRKNILPLLCLVFPLVYFSQMHCRDYRYLVVFLPFVAMFSGLGLSFVIDSLKGFRNIVFAVVLLVVLGFSVFCCAAFYLDNEVVVSNPAAEGYFRFLEGRHVSGEVWTSNPTVAFYSDARLGKIYYPVYDGCVSTDFYDYLGRKSSSIEYVFLDDCGGGILCASDDFVCEENNREMLDFLDANFLKVYDAGHGDCFYLVYQNSEFEQVAYR